MRNSNGKVPNEKVFPFLLLGLPHYQIIWAFPEGHTTSRRGSPATGAVMAV
jgi:hypothetical protein